MTATPEQLVDEERRARKVRHLVDIATNLIMQSNMTRRDAERLVEMIRQQVLELFPGGEQTYEVIYAPRFSRLIREFAGVSDARQGGVMIPFPTPSR